MITRLEMHCTSRPAPEMDAGWPGDDNDGVQSDDTGSASQGTARPRRRVVVAFLIVVAGMLAVLLEGGARVWSLLGEYRDRKGPTVIATGPRLTPAQVEAAGRALGLDAYETADPVRPGRWRLRAGYRGTLHDVLEDKRAAGRVLAVRHIEAAATSLGIGPDDVAVEVNAEGFRGPALRTDHTGVRILALGDSCTFGTPVAERYTYPRAMERGLESLGHRVEVVNGGVEGYDPSDVLVRLDEFRGLRPEITTLYIGWNALYRERYLEDVRGLARHLYSVRLLRHVRALVNNLLADPHQAALEAYERPKRPDRTAPELALLDDYQASFVPQLVRIVEAMKAAGSRVVIVTLPGLYSMDRDPSQRALEIGHLPTSTDNPFVLARMAGRYNETLRAIAHDRGLDLVDLEAWARENLQPADEHFIDSVHLDERSQEQAGLYLAGALAPLLAAARSGATAGPNRAGDGPR
jgi:lysophospholipase L1-like esterase